MEELEDASLADLHQGRDVRVREGRVGSVDEIDEIAAAVVFLNSDAARSITGVNLPVDGGWQAYGYT